MRLSILIKNVSIVVVEKHSKVTILVLVKKSQSMLGGNLPALGVDDPQVLKKKRGLDDIL